MGEAGDHTISGRRLRSFLRFIFLSPETSSAVVRRDFFEFHALCAWPMAVIAVVDTLDPEIDPMPWLGMLADPVTDGLSRSLVATFRRENSDLSVAEALAENPEIDVDYW